MPFSAFTPVDLYCERLGPEFWAEPLNALTNAGFIVAAWLVWRLADRLPGRMRSSTQLLITLLATIGVGSFLFHTLALATLLFTASITFRSLDMQVCDWLNTGTHALWHLVNAGVLYFSARALVVNEDRGAAAATAP